MKLNPRHKRSAISALRPILVLSAVALLPWLLFGSAPSWWTERGVLIQNAPADDYAPANHGQLKNISKAAVTELDTKLAGGAGDTLHQLITNWSSVTPETNDFAPLNLGQLKNVAKLFYDRLIAAGLVTEYPWANPPSPPDDFAVANIGQLKNLFSFDLAAVDPLYDGDHNGLPDQWERQYFGTTGVDPNADPDSDGISNLQEYLNGTDPTDFFNGSLMGLAISSGSDQRGDPGTLLPVPFSIRVSGLYTYGVPDAPVTFMVPQGNARLFQDQAATGLPATELTVRANAFDNDGYPVARVYILLPPEPGVSVIRASVHSGTHSLSSATTATAVDPSLLPPSNLVVTATSATSAKLTWNSSDNTSATTVQVSVDGGGTWITLGAVAAGISQATVTGLTPRQTVRFRVFSGGNPLAGGDSSFHLPDPSAAPPPISPPPGSGGGAATGPVEVAPLLAPILEIDQTSVTRVAYGYQGLLDQIGFYRDRTTVLTSNFTGGDGVPDPTSGTTTWKDHWVRSEDGGSSYVISTMEVIGGGGFLSDPWETVINTNTVFKLEGAPRPGYTGGSSRTVTLDNPFPEGQGRAELAALIPPYYNEFWETHNDATARLNAGSVGFQVTFLRYRFRVNADANLVVTWDVQFTPNDGGPLVHDIQSWSGDGSTHSPVFEVDPRFLNGGKNGFYKVVLLSAALIVDGNRDGEIGAFDLYGRAMDQTTEERPYRFWVNDDDDGAAGDPGDHVPVSTPDYADGVIRSIRDLEDFTRLHLNVGGLEKDLESGTVKLAFEMRTMSGNPKINLYRAISDGTDYLTKQSVAESSMLFPFRDTLGEVAPGVPLFMPQDFWVEDSMISNIPNTLPLAMFLFEASGEGKGKLVATLWKDGHKIAEIAGVWLDLKDVKTLYQHQVLGGVSPWSENKFEPPIDEQKEVIVFVHGWRLSPADTANFAETMFKRIWWRGFKGRFAAIRWDTYFNGSDHGWVPFVGQTIDAYLSKYNDSEHNAWKTGEALRSFVQDTLPPDFGKHLVAHSMGNVVAGSALQQGMAVDNYALLNAALPASCYDESETLKQAPATVTIAGLHVHLWNQLTPEDDPDPATRRLAYRGRLKQATGNLISFCLPDDYATSFAWELNNGLTKPPAASLAGPFLYRRDSPSGQKLIKGFEDPSTGDDVVSYYISDQNEAEPYACRTWGKAVGAEKRTAGPIADSVDLSSDMFSPKGSGGFSKEHSAEFNYDIQKVNAFYVELLTRLNVAQNP
jgi:hypothetical protein